MLYYHHQILYEPDSASCRPPGSMTWYCFKGGDTGYSKKDHSGMTRKAEDEGERGCSTWLVVSLIAGLVVGLTVPINDSASTPGNIPEHCKPDKIEHTASRASQCLGWVSFVCWGISFYPQIFLNFRLKHTKGLSNFYQLMNIAGYSAYTLYNSFFYFSPVVQSKFCLANNGAMNVVRLSDVAFSWHAFLLTWVTVYQITIYSNDKRTGVIAILLFASIAGTTCAFGGTDLNFLYGLGTFKIFVTLIKYMPQVWLNYKRKSTIGWTIHNVLLDFTGGLTSTTQLFVDARSWKEVVADFPKLGLGSISMFFDIIFLVQHYVLYTEPNLGGNGAGDNIEDGDKEMGDSSASTYLLHSSSEQAYAPVNS